MNRLMALFWRCFVLAAGVVMLTSSVAAQSGTITYGSGASGTLNATTPFAFYSFTGNANDLISVQILALTEGLQPSVALNAPNQQQLAFNSGDPFIPGAARITYRLTQTGVYTILVSSSGTTGDFAIRLDGSAAQEATELSGDAPAEGSLTPDTPSLVYAVQANPDSPVTVTISSDTTGFAFSAVVRTIDGQTVAILTGSSTQPVLAMLPPGDATYEIEVRPINPASQGSVRVSLGLIDGLETDETPDTTDEGPTGEVETAIPPTATATTETTDTTCRAANDSGGPINVRSGPGTNYSVTGSMEPGADVPVQGVNSATGWYLLLLPSNAQGWVFGDLLTLTGDCSQLAEIAAPDAPAAQPTTPQQEPVTPTATTQQEVPPTATTQAQEPPTATPTQAVQVAPEDARFNSPLDIPLDGTASVTDFVSYPDGDREDRVRFSVTGMNANASLSGGRANLILAVSCFGSNTNQIQFFTGGNTYSCGQTIFDNEVTFDSSTGSVVITAVGGEGTYVQWVLTGTATRSN